MSDTNNNHHTQNGRAEPRPTAPPAEAASQAPPTRVQRAVKMARLTLFNEYEMRAESGSFKATLMQAPEDAVDDKGRRYPDTIFLVSGVLNVASLFGKDSFSTAEAKALADRLNRQLR